MTTSTISLPSVLCDFFSLSSVLNELTKYVTNGTPCTCRAHHKKMLRTLLLACLDMVDALWYALFYFNRSWRVHHGAYMVVNTVRAKKKARASCDAVLTPNLQHIFFGFVDNLARHSAKCWEQGRNMCSLLLVCNNKMNTFFTSPSLRQA